MSSGLQLIDLNELLDGQPVCQVVLSNACAKISLFSFGATLQSFEIDLPGFSKRDVVLGYPDWKTYRRTFEFPSNAYMGHIVGPIAGRVAHATIPWREDSWTFEANEGQHLLHGGKHCFSNHNWKIKATQQHPHPSVTFELQEKEKFNLVFEEVAVMALERYGDMYYKKAYNRMLKKFILNHCPIWEGIWIVQNHKELLQNIPFNFMEFLNKQIKQNENNTTECS